MTVILYRGWYSPELCRACPSLTFVFGDNTLGFGKGGQAIIRSEPNAFGVPTKRKPAMSVGSFFAEGSETDMDAVLRSLGRLWEKLEGGECIVVPVNDDGRPSLGLERARTSSKRHQASTPRSRPTSARCATPTGAKKRTTKPPSVVSHVILSDDPEVKTAQGMLIALTHCGKKGLSLRHLKVLQAVDLIIKVTKGRAYPKASEIAGRIGVPAEEFESELRDLVELRYLHEMHSRFGELVMTYKLGSMGGRLMQQVHNPGNKLKPGGLLPDGKGLE